ncbi:hypothetical protein CY34DRAFT_808153 [Suillus luteus UH-Slu-Lm8-n1]|uniref:Unplaced genomic scaffold CY34scaffold_206, whole genome shotgun sequence n=1 Tax=Suillus luteus UH-Slu-Lm8-n1 TaxID=930992 RepID=A0A0C9ZPJ8_9AGAM|nr:hypothetical protein CY34DRAFT_808153 [Suillus luteus UH-Slu-Lm8-n1]
MVYATGLCYFLAPAGLRSVITTVITLLFTSRNTVQPVLPAPSINILPRYVALILENAIDLSILEYVAWLLSCSVIMYSTHSFWEKLLMVIPILAFLAASPLHHQLQSKMEAPVRDGFVTVGDRNPDLLPLDHPLSKLVVDTKTELSRAHSLLRSFAAASVHIRGPLDITWAVQKYSRLIGNRRSQIIRFVSPWRFNPNSPITPPPLGLRYAMLHNEAGDLDISWLSTQCDLFLKTTICHEMLKAILLDVEKTGHLPDDN